MVASLSDQIQRGVGKIGEQADDQTELICRKLNS